MRFYQHILAWVKETLLSWEVLWQLGVVAMAFLLASVLVRPLRRRLSEIERRAASPLLPLVHAARDVLTPLGAFVGLVLVNFGAWLGDMPVAMVAGSLCVAWVGLRLMTAIFRNKDIARGVAGTAWSIAALHVLGLLEQVSLFLDNVGFQVGRSHVSILMIAKGLGLIALFLGIAVVLSRLVERRIDKLSGLTPSLRVLFSKLASTMFIVMAVLMGLGALGVNLTALAVFGGAVGVGVGFGLQKVISNFISGIILLADRSIKPGDVIVIGDTYGWVNTLGARHVSVITRDGKEHLIPNETLITERVENWSYSTRNVRLRIPVGVDYQSDLRLAIALLVEAARETPRVIADPAPNCLVMGFGDSAVNLELRIWINDPSNGTSNVRSDVMLRAWDKFRERGVQIPFPQRDLHLKSVSPEVAATLSGADQGSGRADYPR